MTNPAIMPIAAIAAYLATGAVVTEILRRIAKGRVTFQVADPDEEAAVYGVIMGAWPVVLVILACTAALLLLAALMEGVLRGVNYVLSPPDWSD